MDLCFIAGAGVKECCRAPFATFKYWNDAVVGGNVVMSLPAGAMVSRKAAVALRTRPPCGHVH